MKHRITGIQRENMFVFVFLFLNLNGKGGGKRKDTKSDKYLIGGIYHFVNASVNFDSLHQLLYHLLHRHRNFSFTYQPGREVKEFEYKIESIESGA